MTSIIHTKDIDNLFFAKLDLVAKELGASARDMLSVMFSESGCRADAWNDNPKTLPPEKRWNASGLIQFMPFILPGVGWFKTHAEFRQLTATQQLPFVQRYYAPYVRSLPKVNPLASVGGLYTATFLPALVEYAIDPEYVLTARNGRLGWAYGPNAAFDANHDLQITVGELEDAVKRNCRGPRWIELLARLEGADVEEPVTLESEGFDLGTTLGVQRALSRLGYDPGAIDGIPGPHTSKALAEFQAEHELAVDGVYGRRSREALNDALRTVA